jgi:hypothetical protein
MTSDNPFEGKIVILLYTECDLDSEDSACLVYRVEHGELTPLHGVMNLPAGLSWHRNDYDQYQVALAVIRKTGCQEVFTPEYTISEKPFFGQELGFTALSEGLNEHNEIEEWFELGAFIYTWEMIELLEDNQITVNYIDPDTMLVRAEKN